MPTLLGKCSRLVGQDEIIVQIVLVVLGDGVRLFGEALASSSLVGAHVRRQERDAHGHTLSSGRAADTLIPFLSGPRRLRRR